MSHPYKSPLVGRNKNGIIPDWSQKLYYSYFSIHFLLVSMLIHIVLFVSTVVLCNTIFLNVFYIVETTFIETDLRLVDGLCVTSLLEKMADIS